MAEASIRYRSLAVRAASEFCYPGAHVWRHCPTRGQTTRSAATLNSWVDCCGLQVAAAMDSTSVPRDQIFLTTKIPCCPFSLTKSCSDPEFGGTAAQSIARDIKLLGRPVDLLLLHWPCDHLADTLSSYAALKDALAKGLTRAIGVSNFNASMLKKILPAVKVKPAVNQCGHSIGWVLRCRVFRLIGVCLAGHTTLATIQGLEATMRQYSSARNMALSTQRILHLED